MFCNLSHTTQELIEKVVKHFMVELRSRNVERKAEEPPAKTTSPPAKPAVVSLPAGVGVTLLAVLKNLAFTVLTPSPATAINRTAIFLLVFTTVHMLGNITLFLGADAFNGYGYFLRNNPAINFIEAYLALGLIIHAFVAMYLSYKKWSTIKKQPMMYGKLLASSIFVTAFLVVHLKNFRFGPEYNYHTKSDFTIPGKGTVQGLLILYANAALLTNLVRKCSGNSDA